MRAFQFALLAVGMLPIRPAHAEPPRTLSLIETLRLAEQASPELKAAKAREQQAREGVSIRQSYYYPTLEAQAIQGYGFPGSNGSLGIEGLMGSAFRKGPAGGLVSKLSLFDMRRDSELGVERRRLQVVETQTRLTRYKVDQEAAQAYFDAARYHGAFEAWKDVSARIAEIAVDVDRLVKTGQHSMVEKLLVQDQAEDAALNEAVFTERYSGTLKRLALLVDMREAPIEVASATISGAELNGLGPALESPFLVRAKAERETARAAVSAREAQNYPRVSAMASVGAMDNAILVGKKDYSGGFGVVLPLFEGFGYSSAIKQSKAAVEEKDFDLQSAKLAVDVFDARADEVIGASRIKAQLLERELDTARRAFAEAKRRYLAFEGPLVDVRESVRNLGRIEPQLSDARADWFFNAASKAFIDGAGLP